MITLQKPATAPAIAHAVADLDRQGYAVMSGLLPPDELREAAALVDQVVERGEANDSTGCFGYGIHPLVARQPRLARFFAHPIALAACGAWLGDDPVLVHTGARVVDPRHAALGGRIGWHTHRFDRDEAALPPGHPRRGERGGRLLFGWYLDGSSRESGALIGLPRRFDDPIAAPVVDRGGEWPGEAAVEAPPGSLILFTIDLWHTAASGTGGRRRRLMGAHVMGRADLRKHAEDHDHNDARLDALPAELLRAFRR